MTNVASVKNFTNERHEYGRYDGALGDLEIASIRDDMSGLVFGLGQNTIYQVSLAVIMVMVAMDVLAGNLTVGSLVLMLSLMAQFYRPIEILAFVYRNIREALIDSEQLLSLLTMKPDVKDRPGAPDLFVTRGEIRFDNVTFGYDDTRTILHGISFTVPAGTKCAIVGRTGAGKSTIAKLLFRHFDVTTGTITIDGQDIRAVTQESLRRAVGVVPQDTELFNDTITYNIGYGRTEGSGGSVALPEEIEDAARRAELDESIGKMSDGYETVVGERGLKLSGGEQQRVAIARVLLKDPAILVLDEATSSLDTRTEQAIQTALDGVSASRTTLVIAHRLSTIMNADQIIVLEDGRIAERGTHGALLAQDGLYASMWQRQTA